MGFLDRYRHQSISIPDTPREYTPLVLGALTDSDWNPHVLRAILNLATRYGWEGDEWLRATIPVISRRLIEMEPSEDTFEFLLLHLRGSSLGEEIKRKIEDIRARGRELQLPLSRTPDTARL